MKMHNQAKMNLMRAGLLSLCTLILTAGGLQAQDRIYLIGEDKPLVGEIKSINKTEVKFETRKQEERLLAPNEIANIKWDGEPARFSAGRNMEEGGNYERALDAYQDALGAVSSAAENIKDDIRYHRLRTEAKMVLANEKLPDGKDAEAVITALQTFLKERRNFYAYYPGRLLLGRLYQHQKNPTALDVYVELQKAPWAEYQVWGLTAEGRQKLNQDDPKGALQLFEKAIKLPVKGTTEQLAQAEASLGKAESLSKLNQSEAALELIEKLIDSLPESAAAVQSRIYLTQGRLYQTLKRNKEATVAFLHIDILFPSETREHAEALYHLSRLWAAQGKPERAAIAANKLEQQYPDSKWFTELSKTN